MSAPLVEFMTDHELELSRQQIMQSPGEWAQQVVRKLFHVIGDADDFCQLELADIKLQDANITGAMTVLSGVVDWTLEFHRQAAPILNGLSRTVPLGFDESMARERSMIFQAIGRSVGDVIERLAARQTQLTEYSSARENQ